MPDSHKPTRLSAAVVFLSVMLLASSIVTAWALYTRFSETNARRAEAHRIDQHIAAVAYVDCQEIEKLKKQQRDNAVANFKKLDQTLRLLNLKRTPEIVRVARDQKFDTLKKYAPRACPRQF